MPEAKEHSGHTRPCIDHALHEDPTETTLLPLPDSSAEEDAEQDRTTEEPRPAETIQTNPLPTPLRSNRVDADPATEPPSDTSGTTLT